MSVGSRRRLQGGGRAAILAADACDAQGLELAALSDGTRAALRQFLPVEIGPLTVYDTALRIGARLGLSPQKVYLHAGTRHGAAVLGFGPDRPSISLSELPKPLDELNAEEAEDVLCIYAADLARLAK